MNSATAFSTNCRPSYPNSSWKRVDSAIRLHNKKRPDPMSDDPFQLQRFVDAQANAYGQALRELKAGQKQGHWIWFVFPQLDGLARSETARFYSIRSADEAAAYLNHPVLGVRLIECAEAMLAIDGKSAREILGFPDDVKLRSSMSLFAALTPTHPAFALVLDRYFDRQPDPQTLGLLNEVNLCNKPIPSRS